MYSDVNKTIHAGLTNQHRSRPTVCSKEWLRAQKTWWHREYDSEVKHPTLVGLRIPRPPAHTAVTERERTKHVVSFLPFKEPERWMITRAQQTTCSQSFIQEKGKTSKCLAVPVFLFRAFYTGNVRRYFHISVAHIPKFPHSIGSGQKIQPVTNCVSRVKTELCGSRENTSDELRVFSFLLRLHTQTGDLTG